MDNTVADRRSTSTKRHADGVLKHKTIRIFDQGAYIVTCQYEQMYQKEAGGSSL